jgi:uncharacterized protein (TIGR04255 family)
MPTTLPQYDAPPVVEVVLSTQFAPIPGFTAAHAGRFWATLDGQEWTSAEEAPQIDDAFERFGAERVWASPGLRLIPGGQPARIRIINKDDDHMLQVQPTRFVFNWRRRVGQYPTFSALLPEFLEAFEQFRTHCLSVGIEPLILNQWEVIYVNHIPRDDLWKTPRDWVTIIPCASFPTTGLEGHEPESFASKWDIVIDEVRGRLHVDLRFVRLGDGQGEEALKLQLLARGPIKDERGFDLESGLNLGHETIVRSFDAMTTPTAHRAWKKRES